MVKARRDNVDFLNNRLFGLIVVNAGFIKLLSDVSNSIPFICYLKVISLIFLACSIAVCCFGIKARTLGIVADPDVLWEEQLQSTIKDFRFFVISYWSHSISEYELIIDEKLSYIRKAFYCFLASLICYFSIQIVSSIPTFLLR